MPKGKIIIGEYEVDVPDDVQSVDDLKNRLSQNGINIESSNLDALLRQNNIDLPQASQTNQNAYGSNLEEGINLPYEDDAKMIRKKQLEQALGESKIGGVERTRIANELKNLENSIGKSGGTQLKTKEIEDVLNLINSKDRLTELLNLKSTGFEGEGINTGPIIGADIPWFGKNPKLYPAWLSELMNRGKGLSSGDRGEFRRKILSVFNPTRKTSTGSQSGEKELGKWIAPSVPEETDPDITFYNKGFSSIEEIQNQIINLVKALKKSGKNVSAFEDEYKQSPQDVINSLKKELSTTKGEYQKLFR